MKRRILIAVLALGTIGGYATGVASLFGCKHHREGRRAAFERHVAELCVEAAQKAR